MMCKNCPYWQVPDKLRSCTEWGDCYRVVAVLNPAVLKCVSDSGFNLSVPFDPHDEQYFKNSLTFKKEINKARQKKVDGVRISCRKFFQTRGDYSCEC